MTSPPGRLSTYRPRPRQLLSAARIALASSMFFVVVSCGSLQDAAKETDDSRAVLESAFRSIDRQYATDPSLDDLSFQGLQAVAAQDPLAFIDRADGAFSLFYDDRMIGTWKLRSSHDYNGWSAVVAEALKALRDEFKGQEAMVRALRVEKHP